jgi:hypothetical protein
MLTEFTLPVTPSAPTETNLAGGNRPMLTLAETRLAIVVDPALSLGELANTVGALSIGIGAARPSLAGDELRDREGQPFHTSAKCPVPVLQANGEVLRDLYRRMATKPPEAVMVLFPKFARPLHAFSDYVDALASRALADEPLDGLAIAGPAKWVLSLTGALKLLR